jgi:voltage-gated potassium channel
MTTVTTVGYGDRYPVTTEGRFIAGGLMLAGVALLGIVTASLASWLIDRVREVEEEAQAATRADVAALTAEVRALRAELAEGNPVI